MNMFEKMIADAQTRNTYWEELAIIKFSEEVCQLMEKQGVSRAELARRLNKSQAWVTKLLGGSNNFTLETMVRVSRALGGELNVRVQPEGTQAVWDEQWERNQLAAPQVDMPPMQIENYRDMLELHSQAAVGL